MSIEPFFIPGDSPDLNITENAINKIKVDVWDKILKYQFQGGKVDLYQESAPNRRAAKLILKKHLSQVCQTYKNKKKYFISRKFSAQYALKT